MTLLGHSHKNVEQQQEVREARQLLKEKIRDDWEFPPLPEWQSHRSGRRRAMLQEGGGEQRFAGFRFHAPREGTECRAMSWRERECSSESEAEGASPASVTSTGSKASSKFKFEGPDSVGTQVSERRLARRRKRQRDLEMEMSWNPGLAHWVRQRDAWAGAGTVEHVQMVQQGNEVEGAAIASGTSTPRTSSSQSDHTSSPTTDRSSAATTPDPGPASHVSLPPAATLSIPVPQSEIVIPVAAPILPNHPIRRRITPAIHAEIYTKIVAQGRTPSVPINLLTLVSALVEGWKADGEWPPKSGPVEPSVARKGGKDESAIKHGVKAVGKALRLTHTSHGNGDGG